MKTSPHAQNRRPSSKMQKMKQIFWEHFQNIFRRSAIIDDFPKCLLFSNG